MISPLIANERILHSTKTASMVSIAERDRMSCGEERVDLVVRPTDDILLNGGEYSTIHVMRGGKLEVGEAAIVRRVVIDSDTRRALAIGIPREETT